ncbi:hypothetical protein J6590_027398 [Homalodisca vitripennis]|nr:hypothetical protein J6590_027398 [Homalodisca vitripennis]
MSPTKREDSLVKCKELEDLFSDENGSDIKGAELCDELISVIDLMQNKVRKRGFLFSEENTAQRRGQPVNQSTDHQGFSFRKRTQLSGEDSRSTKVPTTRVSLFGREHSPAERTADQPKSQPPGFLFSEESTAQRRGQQVNQSPNHQGFSFRKRTQPSGEDFLLFGKRLQETHLRSSTDSIFLNSRLQKPESFLRRSSQLLAT